MVMADFIRLVRADRGLSQADLASKLGVTQQSVSKWESAKSWPGFDSLVELTRRVGVTAAEWKHLAAALPADGAPNEVTIFLSVTLGLIREPEVAAHGIDLQELRELDPEGYEQFMAQGRFLLERARERRKG